MGKLFSLKMLLVILIANSSTTLEARQRYDPYAEPPRPSNVQANLSNTQWQLSGVNTSHIRIATSNFSFLKLHFDTSSKINGDTGCNEYYGNYQVVRSGGSSKLTEIDGTKVACIRLGRGEMDFFNALSKTTYYKIEGIILILQDKDRGYLMSFRQLR